MNIKHLLSFTGRIIGSLFMAFIQFALIPFVFLLIIASVDQTLTWLGLDIFQEWLGLQISEQKWRLLLLFIVICNVYLLILQLIGMVKRNLMSKEVSFFWALKKVSIKNPVYSEHFVEKHNQRIKSLLDQDTQHKIEGLEKLNEDLKLQILNLKNRYRYPISMIESVMRLIYWLTEAIKEPHRTRHFYHELLDLTLAELSNSEVLEGLLSQAAIYIKNEEGLTVDGNYCLEHRQVADPIQVGEGFEGSIFAQQQAMAIMDVAQLKNDYTVNKSNTFKSVIVYPFGRGRTHELDGMIVLYLSQPVTEINIVYTNLMLYSEIISSILELKRCGIIEEK